MFFKNIGIIKKLLKQLQIKINLTLMIIYNNKVKLIVLIK